MNSCDLCQDLYPIVVQTRYDDIPAKVRASVHVITRLTDPNNRKFMIFMDCCVKKNEKKTLLMFVFFAVCKILLKVQFLL